MPDTITLLDGLQFTKPTTADVWTVDAANSSPVFSQSIEVPVEVMAARVVFNGAYDPDGGRYHCRVRAATVTAISATAKTIAYAQALEWTTCTPPAVLESAEIDLSGALMPSRIFIDCCMSSTTANTTGIEILIQVRKEATVDEWTTFMSCIGPSGMTAVKSDVGGETAAAETVLNVTNPATGGLDHLGKLIFLEDTVTIAQCEIAFLVAQSGD
jgi:hypothetical protein